MLLLLFFFFFKQKTAYEMRISDWSSDVCSSDLFANSKGFYSDGPYPYKDDDIRMLKNIGAKFIGRSLYSWGSEQRFAEPAFWARANEFIARMHKYDPEMIFQACIFEIVTTHVDEVPVPTWVATTSTSA